MAGKPRREATASFTHKKLYKEKKNIYPSP